MKVAVTGASSTGKTTLVRGLLADPLGLELLRCHIQVDGRALLRELGHRDMDRMSQEQRVHFQKMYVARKRALEAAQADFVTDRSYVDSAAYWVQRDAQAPDSPLVRDCRRFAESYDLHIYCPWGILPFQSDGYRSRDMAMHVRFDQQVQDYLVEWGLRSHTVKATDARARVAEVLAALSVVS